MTHLPLPESLIPARVVHLLVSTLIVGQVLLFCYLLAMDMSASFLLALLYGIPAAIATGLLLTRMARRPYLRMALIMFAVGGFGMMLGCAVDLGRLGLIGLLSICQESSAMFLDPGLVWQKMRLTPWTYIGMFVGGNLAMLLLGGFHPNKTVSQTRLVYLYFVCNVSMLVGMLAGEALAGLLVTGLSQLWAAGLMVSLMLLGMTVGMLVLLALDDSLGVRSGLLNFEKP